MHLNVVEAEECRETRPQGGFCYWHTSMALICNFSFELQSKCKPLSMDEPIRHQFPVLLLVPLVAVLCLQVTAQQDGGTGGLFPPVSFASNFASMTEAIATSTCLSCTGTDCPASSCNASCPFGQDLPSPFSLLETGVASSGAERVSN